MNTEKACKMGKIICKKGNHCNCRSSLLGKGYPLMTQLPVVNFGNEILARVFSLGKFDVCCNTHTHAHHDVSIQIINVFCQYH